LSNAFGPVALENVGFKYPDSDR
jgi:ATP-binding cassette subfamily B protein